MRMLYTQLLVSKAPCDAIKARRCLARHLNIDSPLRASASWRHRHLPSDHKNTLMANLKYCRVRALAQPRCMCDSQLPYFTKNEPQQVTMVRTMPNYPDIPVARYREPIDSGPMLWRYHSWMQPLHQCCRRTLLPSCPAALGRRWIGRWQWRVFLML